MIFSADYKNKIWNMLKKLYSVKKCGIFYILIQADLTNTKRSNSLFRCHQSCSHISRNKVQENVIVWMEFDYTFFVNLIHRLYVIAQWECFAGVSVLSILRNRHGIAGLRHVPVRSPLSHRMCYVSRSPVVASGSFGWFRIRLHTRVCVKWELTKTRVTFNRLSSRSKDCRRGSLIGLNKFERTTCVNASVYKRMLVCRRFSVFVDTANTRCSKRENAFSCECDKTYNLLRIVSMQRVEIECEGVRPGIQ